MVTPPNYWFRVENMFVRANPLREWEKPEGLLGPIYT
jgi:hypothetical protein